MSTTYVIEATPLPRGKGWSLIVDGIGVSQTRRLDQAEEEMRSAIRDLTGMPDHEFSTVLDVKLGQDVRDRFAELDSAQAQANDLVEAVARQRRALALQLREGHDLPLRDVGTLMGLSHQRVSQLLQPARTAHR